MPSDELACGDQAAGHCNGTERGGLVVCQMADPTRAMIQAGDGSIFMCRGVRRIAAAVDSLRVRFSRAVHRLTAGSATVTIRVEGIDFSFEAKPHEGPKTVGWQGVGHGYLPVAGQQTLVTVKTTITIDGSATWRDAPVEYFRGP
jgi:hypothetical protein